MRVTKEEKTLIDQNLRRSLYKEMMLHPVQSVVGSRLPGRNVFDEGAHNPLSFSEAYWHPADTLETSAHTTLFTAAPNTLYTNPVSVGPYLNVLRMKEGDSDFTLHEKSSYCIPQTMGLPPGIISTRGNTLQSATHSHEEHEPGATEEVSDEMIECAKLLTNGFREEQAHSSPERSARKPKRKAQSKRRRSPVPFVGVSKKSPHSFEVKIRDKGKTNYIGTFPTAEEAACAYDVTVIRLRGREKALVNFPAKFGLPLDQKAIKAGLAHRRPSDEAQASDPNSTTTMLCENTLKKFKLSETLENEDEHPHRSRHATSRQPSALSDPSE
eukprot:gb/GECG01000305.1/.p1 GENE.gb/GECG01000305.1/~~gb/GECG01000305.1/.p1  ORF type:complete len:327 (+),score=36.11 gb/GECG01000305.1/:1-981(+)